jgi:hypothetical protein
MFCISGVERVQYKIPVYTFRHIRVMHRDDNGMKAGI